MEYMKLLYLVNDCLQAGLIKYGLSIEDAFVLSQIYNIINKRATHFQFVGEGTPYYYWNMGSFLERVPTLGFGVRQMRRKLKKYCDLRILEKVNQYLPCSGKYPFYTAPHYRFTKEAYGQLFGHKNRRKQGE